MNIQRYKTYSDYLKQTYGEKVYKLPVNLALTCPNRLEGAGCTFCADAGAGFEAQDARMSVTSQLLANKQHIENKYKAHKFIAYFQNYTNTFLPLPKLLAYMEEAALVAGVVEISISTRPDCISDELLGQLAAFSQSHELHIHLELGLQTANYHTLKAIHRGHGLAEFIDAVLRIANYGFTVCTHLILNLPGDTIDDCIETAKIVSVLPVQMVKLHSLYIARHSPMEEAYRSGTLKICSKDEYLLRAAAFLEYVRPDMVIERLFSRIPEADACFCNWGESWWKLLAQFHDLLEERGIIQGDCCTYMNGSKLKLLDTADAREYTKKE